MCLARPRHATFQASLLTASSGPSPRLYQSASSAAGSPMSRRPAEGTSPATAAAPRSRPHTAGGTGHDPLSASMPQGPAVSRDARRSMSQRASHRASRLHRATSMNAATAAAASSAAASPVLDDAARAGYRRAEQRGGSVDGDGNNNDGDGSGGRSRDDAGGAMPHRDQPLPDRAEGQQQPHDGGAALPHRDQPLPDRAEGQQPHDGAAPAPDEKGDKALGHRRSISDVLSASQRSDGQLSTTPASTGSPSEGALDDDSELRAAFGGVRLHRTESGTDTFGSSSAAGSSGVDMFERRKEAAAVFVDAAGGGRPEWRALSSSPASIAMGFLQSMNEDEADKVLFNSTQLLISKDEDVPQSLLPFPVATLDELSNSYYDDDAAPLKEVRFVGRVLEGRVLFLIWCFGGVGGWGVGGSRHCGRPGSGHALITPWPRSDHALTTL